MRLLVVHRSDLASQLADSTNTGGLLSGERGGGMSVYLTSVIQGLRARGHQVTIVEFGPENGSNEKVAEGYHRLKSFRFRYRAPTVHAFQRIVEEERPDVAHLHGVFHHMHPRLTDALARRCPIIWTAHDAGPICFHGTRVNRRGEICQRAVGLGCVGCGCFRPGERAAPGEQKSFSRDFLRVALHERYLKRFRNVSRVLVPSQYMRQALLENGFDPARVEVVPQFSRFPVEPVAAALPSSPPRILYVGRLEPGKGVEAFLQALGRLPEEAWTACVVGSGSLLARAHALAGELGISDRVRFAGSASGEVLAGHYRACSFVVFSTLLPESFGLVGVEAMSFGKPVVAFASGGVTQWLEDSVTGLSAPHGDVAALAEQIRRLLRQPDLIATLGQAARQRVQSDFTLDRHLDQLEEIYRRVVPAPVATAAAKETPTPSPLRSVLVITPLDYEKMPNNMEHAFVRYYRKQGIPLVVMHLHLNRSSRFWDMLWDTVTFRVRERREEGTRFLAIDPFFNYYSGFRAHADARVKAERGRLTLKYILIRMFAPLAFMRDLFFTPCFVAAALWKLPGRFDACHGMGPWGALVGLILRRLGKVKTLVYNDKDYEPGLMPDRLRTWYCGVVERFGQRRADLVFSVGYRLAALRRRQSGIESIVIPGGVDWPAFEISRRPRARTFTLLYVGALTTWSGMEQNIRAMPKLLAALPAARLLIVGHGLPDYDRFLRQLAGDLGISHAVEFAGLQPYTSLPGFLARSDIGLANSQPVAFRQYACPIKSVEYMAGGLPFLATNETEAADIVRKFDCGLAVPFDIDAIAEALRQMLTDQGCYERWRANALEQGSQFDINQLLTRERELIEDDVKARGVRGKK